MWAEGKVERWSEEERGAGEELHGRRGGAAEEGEKEEKDGQERGGRIQFLQPAAQTRQEKSESGEDGGHQRQENVADYIFEIDKIVLVF